MSRPGRSMPRRQPALRQRRPGIRNVLLTSRHSLRLRKQQPEAPTTGRPEPSGRAAGAGSLNSAPPRRREMVCMLPFHLLPLSFLLSSAGVRPETRRLSHIRLQRSIPHAVRRRMSQAPADGFANSPSRRTPLRPRSSSNETLRPPELRLHPSHRQRPVWLEGQLCTKPTARVVLVTDTTAEPLPA